LETRQRMESTRAVATRDFETSLFSET